MIMETFIKNIKELFAYFVGSDLPEKDLKGPVFRIAVETPYPVEDIIEFMNLTGIDLKETEILLKRFSKYGISNIKDVIILVKFGYFHYIK